MSDTALLDTLPLCPFCERGRLVTLVAFIICAYCKKAWKDYEFFGDLRRIEREREEAGRDVADR